MMIHSAALVDWSLPYSMLREANVLGTLRMLRVTPRGWYVFFFFG
jgi:thioester reductase-like protein